jgi:NADH dehydrogenase
MSTSEIHVVTGAFGYSGRYIAQRLLDQGRRVRTLTHHFNRPDPFHGRVEVEPYHFERPDLLTDSLRGAVALYNTYWIRLSRGNATFDQAVANTRTLIRSAINAGVGRFIHMSVTNPSEDSPLPYFRGKALAESAVRESGLSYAILRPTLLFGEGDILVNNIAWLLRRLPVFGVFGSGNYQLQPVFVGDVADLAVRVADDDENLVIDAVGPETYTYEELVRLIRRHVGSRTRLVRVAPVVALAAARWVGWLTRDVVITPDEVTGLMASLLVSGQPPTCPTRLSEWIARYAQQLGNGYASELQRHYR